MQLENAICSEEYIAYGNELQSVENNTRANWLPWALKELKSVLQCFNPVATTTIENNLNTAEI